MLMLLKTDVQCALKFHRNMEHHCPAHMSNLSNHNQVFDVIIEKSDYDTEI